MFSSEGQISIWALFTSVTFLPQGDTASESDWKRKETPFTDVWFILKEICRKKDSQ